VFCCTVAIGEDIKKKNMADVVKKEEKLTKGADFYKETAVLMFYITTTYKNATCQ
jgi:hypothetical protein